jgi:hypothetical protein
MKAHKNSIEANATPEQLEAIKAGRKQADDNVRQWDQWHRNGDSSGTELHDEAYIGKWN